MTLESHERALMAAPRRAILSAKDWAVDVPREAGVYAIWQSDTPIYVGESSGLKARMSDLARPVNHSFTKKTCVTLSLVETSLQELAAAMSSRYALSFIAVPFGRAEIEEYLILRWRNSLVNKPATRLLKSPQYQWVKAAA